MNAGQFQEAFRELMKDAGTSVAGHILAFNAATQLAQVQIGVSSRDRSGNVIVPDPIIECPVEFSGGGGWSFEHKLIAGDEGLIIFSQRCLDGWIQTGGVANNPIARFHDKQDACFIPGIRSKPKAIKDFQNNGIRLRNTDASVYHWLKDDGTIESVNPAGFIKLLPSGIVNINGFTIDTSGLAIDGNGVGSSTHIHSQAADSDGNSQVDTNAPTPGV